MNHREIFIDKGDYFAFIVKGESQIIAVNVHIPAYLHKPKYIHLSIYIHLFTVTHILTPHTHKLHNIFKCSCFNVKCCCGYTSFLLFETVTRKHPEATVVMHILDSLNLHGSTPRNVPCVVNWTSTTWRSQSTYLRLKRPKRLSSDLPQVEKLILNTFVLTRTTYLEQTSQYLRLKRQK